MEAVRGDLADEVDLLEARCMVDAALKNAAAVAMGADSNAVVCDSIENELSISVGEVVQALLDDVIAIEVLNHADNLVGEGMNDNANLES